MRAHLQIDPLVPTDTGLPEQEEVPGTHTTGQGDSPELSRRIRTWETRNACLPLSQQRVYLSEVRDIKVKTGGAFPRGEVQPTHGHVLTNRATRAVCAAHPLTPGASTQTHIHTSLQPWKTLSHKREKWIKRWSGRGLSSLGVWPHRQLPMWVLKTFKVPSSIVWGVHEVAVFPHV